MLAVRCLFVDRPNAMVILGRTDFLDRFVLTIDQPRRRLVLSDVPVAWFPVAATASGRPASAAST
jgi:hypothetical protein